MKLPIALCLLACLLLAPSALASPAGTTLQKETDSFLAQDAGVQVSVRYDFTVADPAAWSANASWEAWTPAGLSAKPVVRVDRSGLQTTIDPGRVNTTTGAASGFQAYRVDLQGLFSDLQSGESVSLAVSYSSSSSQGMRHHVVYDVPMLVVYALPGPGQVPKGEGLPDFAPADERYHAVRNDAPAGLEYTLSFAQGATSTATPASSSKLYLWAVVGFVAGVAVAMVVLRRKPKAKKFEKGGAVESRDMLEARRRTLMAALKELEVAHEAKQVPDSAYAPLKEEYKAQAVRVLRTLDEKKEPPAGPA